VEENGVPGVLNGEAVNVIVFCLTQSALEHTIYHTKGEHANHCITISVPIFGLIRPALEPTIYHTRREHTSHYTTDAVPILELNKFDN
jgi:hypothetical protein